jgi:hypothetical protein
MVISLRNRFTSSRATAPTERQWRHANSASLWPACTYQPDRWLLPDEDPADPLAVHYFA